MLFFVQSKTFENLSFDGFEDLLKSDRVKNPGDTDDGYPTYLVYVWFDLLIKNANYYAYIGSYIDVDEDEQYPGAIYIIPTSNYAFLTEEQVNY